MFSLSIMAFEEKGIFFIPRGCLTMSSRLQSLYQYYLPTVLNFDQTVRSDHTEYYINIEYSQHKQNNKMFFDILRPTARSVCAAIKKM